MSMIQPCLKARSQSMMACFFLLLIKLGAHILLPSHCSVLRRSECGGLGAKCYSWNLIEVVAGMPVRY